MWTDAPGLEGVATSALNRRRNYNAGTDFAGKPVRTTSFRDQFSVCRSRCCGGAGRVAVARDVNSRLSLRAHQLPVTRAEPGGPAGVGQVPDRRVEGSLYVDRILVRPLLKDEEVLRSLVFVLCAPSIVSAKITRRDPSSLELHA